MPRRGQGSGPGPGPERKLRTPPRPSAEQALRHVDGKRRFLSTRRQLPASERGWGREAAESPWPWRGSAADAGIPGPLGDRTGLGEEASKREARRGPPRGPGKLVGARLAP